MDSLPDSEKNVYDTYITDIKNAGEKFKKGDIYEFDRQNLKIFNNTIRTVLSKLKSEKVRITCLNKYNDDHISVIELITMLNDHFNSNEMDSYLNVVVNDFYNNFNVLRANDPTQYSLIDDLLLKHGWDGTGFYSPPNRKSIADGLTFIVNHLLE